MIKGECKKLLYFPVTSKSSLDKWYKNLGLFSKGSNEKMQMDQNFYVDTLAAASSFIKNENPAQVFL